MKTILITLSVLTLAIIALFFVLGMMSKSGKAPGLVDGRLSQCPDRPNCVCSEPGNDAGHTIAPIRIPDDSALDPLPVLKQLILEMGGTVQAESGSYLAATFSSAIFGFVDDLEIRVDVPQRVIHVRSASRVGHSDMGVNRQRSDLLKKLYINKVSDANLSAAVPR